MSPEHAVTVYLSEPLWQTLQTTARAEQDTVAEVIVTTLAQALITTPEPTVKPATKTQPRRQQCHPAFALWLRYARERLGWTAAYLARQTALDDGYIRHLERNERAPSGRTVGRLARALRLSADETTAFYGAAGFLKETMACAS